MSLNTSFQRMNEELKKLKKTNQTLKEQLEESQEAAAQSMPGRNEASKTTDLRVQKLQSELRALKKVFYFMYMCKCPTAHSSGQARGRDKAKIRSVSPHLSF